MRVCFCVSSLFLLLVLFEEQRFVLLCPRGRKKERRRKKTSSSAFKFSRIFKNFYLLTTRKSAQQNTHCFHAPRSIQVRVQNVRTRALSFGLLLKVPSSNASKLSHKSEKSECIEKFISLPERGLLVVERKAVLRHKKSEKKTTMVQLIGNFDFAALCLPTVPWGKSTRKMQFFRKVLL